MYIHKVKWNGFNGTWKVETEKQGGQSVSVSKGETTFARKRGTIHSNVEVRWRNQTNDSN